MSSKRRVVNLVSLLFLLRSISKSLLIRVSGIFFNTLQSRNVRVTSAPTKVIRWEIRRN